MLEAPAKLLQSFRVIRAYLAEKEQEAMRKAEAELKDKLKQTKK